MVTRLDHDANVTPWVLAAEERGCEVLWVDFHPEDGTLDMDEMQAAFKAKPRLVAVGYASNALGTINPVAQITRLAHEAGALVYVDAVQYAPHGPIDVQRLAAISWCARPTSFSVRTWGCSTGAMICWTG